MKGHGGMIGHVKGYQLWWLSLGGKKGHGGMVGHVEVVLREDGETCQGGWACGGLPVGQVVPRRDGGGSKEG